MSKPNHSFSSSGYSGRPAPPLPPRSSVADDPPPAYSSLDRGHSSNPRDERSASTQSISPTESSQDGRRKLLIIYIHGFKGTDESFRGLPAQVHNLVSIALADSHVVYTKIYPRYKTRGDPVLLAEDFSRWLAPHESPTSDTVLLGHSMGGILAAEVAFKPPLYPSPVAFRHRIVGTIGFDCPYLGMHPHVIQSGVKLAFKSPEKEQSTHEGETQDSQRTDSPAPKAGTTAEELAVAHDLLFPPPNDPHFNPVYSNDIPYTSKRKMLDNALHFVTKNKDDIRGGLRQIFDSHMDYAGDIMPFVANDENVTRRYNRLRSLEDEDEQYRRQRIGSSSRVPRVRFANYYTSCVEAPPTSRSRSHVSSRSHSRGSRTPTRDNGSHARSSSSQIELGHGDAEYRSNDRSDSLDADQALESVSPRPMSPRPISPRPIDDSEDSQDADNNTDNTNAESGDHTPQPSSGSIATSAPPSLLSYNDAAMKITSRMSSLPPIPPVPELPKDIDASQFEDADMLKIAQKDHARATKSYKQAVKDRNEAIKDRKKLEEKLRKAFEKQEKTRHKEEQKELKKIDEENKSKEKEMIEAQKRLNDLAIAQEESGPSGEENADENEGKEAPKIEHAPDPSNANVQPLLTPSEENLRSRERLHTQSHHRGRSSPSHTPMPEEAPKLKKKTSKKFCRLPRKDGHGNRDPTWVRVEMEGMEPPEAHSAIFIPSTIYEKLVGDVAGKIEQWVRDDMTRRYVEMFKRMG